MDTSVRCWWEVKENTDEKLPLDSAIRMSVVILARAVSLGVFGGINQASVGSRVSVGRSLKSGTAKRKRVSERVSLQWET